MKNADKFKIGNEVMVKGKTYIVKQVEVTSVIYPNTKRKNPNIDLHIILEGKRGALKSGYVLVSGEVVFFF